MAETQDGYRQHQTYRSSWLAPAPGVAALESSALEGGGEGGADYFGLVDFDSTRRQPYYALDTSFENEDRGTPLEGIYARDGLWDEDEDSVVQSSSHAGMGSSWKGRSAAGSMHTSGTSRDAHSSSAAPSTARSSLRMRSRSGTVSSAKGKDAEEGDKGMWSWARRARPSDPPMVAQGPVAVMTIEKKVKKKESKGLLKGKGRRGELTVQVDAEEPCVPPLPSTPSSYLRTPATGSPFVFSPASPAVHGAHPSPALVTGDEKKGSWKRGVSKLFRSKSSAVLRDITTSNANTPAPATPVIPKQYAHLQTGPVGKPLSASTPPFAVMQAQKPKGKQRSSLAPAFQPRSASRGPMSPTVTSPVSPESHFGIHPELPSDPFASTLTAAPASPPPTMNDDEELPLPERPKTLRSSSSLRSLKELFTQSKQPRSPLLSKTKSMANIKSRMSPEATIPEVPTPMSSSFSGRTPRPSRPASLDKAKEVAVHAAGAEEEMPASFIPPAKPDSESLPETPQMPCATAMAPVESPPLMPPAPPFSRNGSSRLSSSPSSTATSPGFYSSSSSSSDGAPQLSINTSLPASPSGFPFPSPSTLPPLPVSAPTSPLPPIPGLPMPSMQALAECVEGEDVTSPVGSQGSKPTSPLVPRKVVKKSSSHVLLPRSRSTSMSLKSPPTSSSFFDLYEQLGIWPTQEKKEEAEIEKGAAGPDPETAIDANAENVKDRIAASASPIQLLPPVNTMDEAMPITSMSASSSGLFSSASWEAAVNAFPEIPDLQEPDESSIDHIRAMSRQMSDDDHTFVGNTSNVAVLAISPTTSQTHTAPSSPISVLMSRNGSHTQTANSGQASGSTQATQGQSSSSGQQSGSSYGTATAGPSSGRSGLSGPGGVGGGKGDDDDDEEERWYDSWSRTSDLSSEDEDEDEDDEESSDDVPLSQIHPGAVAAQKARKARHAAARKDKRGKGKVEQIKLIGRNPGGDSGWNGEGGVPGDVLRMKLERLVLPPGAAPLPPSMISPTTPSGYPWAASAGAVRSGSSAGLEQTRTRVHSGGKERTAAMLGDTAVSSGFVGRRPSAPTLGSTNVYADKSVSRRPSRQAMQAHPATASHLTGYTSEQVQYGGKSPVLPPSEGFQAGPPVSVPRTSSRHTSGGNSSAHSAGVSRRPTMSSAHGHGSTSRVPQTAMPLPTTLEPPSAALGRSNTVSSRRGPIDSRSSSTRKRAQSNAAAHKAPGADALPPVPQPHPHTRGATEPIRSSVTERTEHPAAPAPTSTAAPALPTIKFYAHLAAFDNKLVSYPLQIDCTAHDLLAAAARSGDIAPPPGGMSWVVAEIFGELGCERVLREYEEIGTVMRGWEGRKGAEGAGRNHFVIRQEIGEQSLMKAIPQTAPFVGGWTQYESKGKWSKRWLETRGGQVFMAKNEKNKDEVQINTLFGDVYQMTKHIGAPRAFTFVIKRMEPEASFEKRDDWAHVFSMDEGVGFKLMSAIYDAKSFTLRPHLLARQGGQVQRRPTIPAQGPLVDMGKQLKKEEKKGPFTGKGLLRL